MRFYEFESKRLFGKYGIPLPKGSKVAKTPDEAKAVTAEINGPVVLKSQVLSGGRMKAGGVLFADTPDQAADAAKRILALEINGHKPRGVLVEARAPIAQEYYVGVTWDGVARLPVMIFSDMGGIDIEEVAEKHPDHISKRHFSTLTPFSDFMAKELVASVGISGDHLNRLSRIAASLARIFQAHGLTLAEINPLARLDDGTFFCLDGHVDMEDDARDTQKAVLKDLGIDPDEKRQARPPTEFEIKGAQVDAADPRGVAGNVVEFDGDLGLVIGAGGGSLTLFDAIRKHGGKPANYCEIGGNPSVSKTCELTKLILSKPGVKKIAVMMNVVSNTRVDIVARGVIKGVIESGHKPSEKIAIFRIPGSWETEGFKILEHYGVEYCDRKVSMFEAAGRAVAKMKT
ncbi:MAG TPA: ATP-grasp domain-containing protein [Candidatus Acidoferrales bacterium]|nr:ATP-grasp domain-containing protein [Candidatus Acidoferrales bacterium]